MKKYIFFLALFLINSIHSNAISFVGADLTYSCIGGNTYVITYSLYQDCNDTLVPDSQMLSVECSSNSSMNSQVYLHQISFTGQDVTPFCGCDTTTCLGGTSFGVREFVYQKVLILLPCDMWKIKVSGCCRNTVSSVQGGSSNSFMVETSFNNLITPCNSGPIFSDKPIVIPCKGKSFCLNHGALEADGDSLSFSFDAPRKNDGTAVSYLYPWSTSNFLSSSTPITLDSITGDICFVPDSMMSSITGILVKEYRTINGIPTLIGTTKRNIQFRIMSCPNSIPVLSGIDTLNTHTYNPNDSIFNMDWPIGKLIDFDINGYDADTAIPGCNVHPEAFSIIWNNGIPSATFTPHFNGTDSAYAHFQWQPTFADVASSPHCFVATISDEACPYMGMQSFAYCITVTSGVGIEDNNKNTALRLYPNPSSGIFEISYSTASESDCYLHIYNVEGKEVFTQVWRLPNIHKVHKLNLIHLPNGVYYLNLIQNEQLLKYKILIEK
ncbi:MAG: T9SS type A sorting domain-containing protein [Bacteroidales bacterium]|nr:T9SS type A sorting domain-containing protein [Bacteroidales bacterium]